MKQTGGKSMERMRITFVLVGGSLLGFVIAYVTMNLQRFWAAERSLPRLAVDSLVKALRAHHRQTGRFPADFRELESRIWKHPKPPDFGVDGRSLSVANYYYLYHPLEAGSCTIWIIPVGPRREEGSTHFLLLTPDRLRRWKGAPLSLDETKKLPPVPQYRELSVLGMSEQPQIDLAGRKP